MIELLLIPFISIAFDWGYLALVSQAYAERPHQDWTKPLSSYFRTGDLLMRNGLLALSLVAILAARRLDGADQGAAFAAALLLFGLYVGVGIWSFVGYLREFWKDDFRD